MNQSFRGVSACNFGEKKRSAWTLVFSTKVRVWEFLFAGWTRKKSFFSWADLYEPIGSGELIKSKKKYTLHHNINVNKELSSLETSIFAK